ncbi:hypothetical protein JQC67_09005 [Aurantibacter crassamenti]|uniref:hypothetical protein n=1 Tax=Aurantibacter crassamenti TaxID=1837375 RepID=UPI0019398B91|nr:hypothetical protein [Aurantibacter crassamenti]MBM1106272.1 hypothetical protein [Aurantibacter crassamenti]
MLELLKNNFFIVLYALTWVLSIIKLPKYFDSTLKYFPIIIGYTMCTEILGALIYNFPDFTLFSEEKYTSYTLLIYNIYDLIFFSFFFYVYWKSISNAQFKNVLKYGALAFILSLTINAIFLNPMLYELWYAYIIGSTILITASITYLREQWSKVNRTHLTTNLLLWISLGLLIFHLGYTPITIYKNLNLDITLANYNNLRTIHISLIVLMYTCFMIGLLKMRRFKL